MGDLRRFIVMETGQSILLSPELPPPSWGQTYNECRLFFPPKIRRFSARLFGIMAYYDEKLSGENLRRCYEIASPRVKRYLMAEIGFILPFVRPGDQVLELGCGYGRICFELEDTGAHLTGIDTERESITLARACGLSKFLRFSGSRCSGHRIRGGAI